MCHFSQRYEKPMSPDVPRLISIKRPHPIHQVSQTCSDWMGSFILVEARGVEPLSESVFMGISPGADSHLHSLTQAWADTLKGLVAS